MRLSLHLFDLREHKKGFILEIKSPHLMDIKFYQQFNCKLVRLLRFDLSHDMILKHYEMYYSKVMTDHENQLNRQRNLIIHKLK